MTITDPRAAKAVPAPTVAAPSGPGVLNGHTGPDTQRCSAVEGQTSPQANRDAITTTTPPAGSKTAPPASRASAPTAGPLEGRETSRSQEVLGIQMRDAAADDFPGRHLIPATHPGSAAGDQSPPAANRASAPKPAALLADPLLALAADVLSDLEKVRVANENRLRQLTRCAEDSDGETRGFGLDEAHPDVARLAALVGMLAGAEHKATLNLQRVMRKHPLGPWVAAQKGIGEKQGARLLAAIGDPYIRPEITREDGTAEPPRPRLVSELWAYCGYHVVPAGQTAPDTQPSRAGGERNGSDPGQVPRDTQSPFAGVAPKRQRGEHANWSAAAKMRAYLAAESCMKQRESPYRAVYDATRAKYAEAIHAAGCVRCGPKSKPAPPGSPLSDGHKHARALRAVAKEILRDLWREARRIHEEIA